MSTPPGSGAPRKSLAAAAATAHPVPVRSFSVVDFHRRRRSSHTTAGAVNFTVDSWMPSGSQTATLPIPLWQQEGVNSTGNAGAVKTDGNGNAGSSAADPSPALDGAAVQVARRPRSVGSPGGDPDSWQAVLDASLQRTPIDPGAVDGDDNTSHGGRRESPSPSPPHVEHTGGDSSARAPSPAPASTHLSFSVDSAEDLFSRRNVSASQTSHGLSALLDASAGGADSAANGGVSAGEAAPAEAGDTAVSPPPLPLDVAPSEIAPPPVPGKRRNRVRRFLARLRSAVSRRTTRSEQLLQARDALRLYDATLRNAIRTKKAAAVEAERQRQQVRFRNYAELRKLYRRGRWFLSVPAAVQTTHDHGCACQACSCSWHQPSVGPSFVYV